MKAKAKTRIIIVVIALAMWMSGCRDDVPSAAPVETPLSVPTEIGLAAEPDLPTATVASPAELSATDTAAADIPELGPAIPWNDRSIFRDGLIASEQGVLHQMPGASVYQIDFQIADDFLQLAGWEEIHYTNQEAEPLAEIYFQLFPNAAGGQVTISDVMVDNQAAVVTYEFENTALRVPLTNALQPGDAVDIRLKFVVDIPQQMAGNYGLYGYFNEVLVLDEFYPVIPVYDDEGWNVQAPPPNADTSYFDMSFYWVRVSAPANLTVAATGIESSREQEGDRQIVTFAAGPVRDFYLAASEQFVVVSETVGETVLNSYVLEAYEQSAKTALTFAKDAMNSFGERFGPYPYTEFDVLSTPMLALGIEYPGIVGVTIPAFDPAGEVAGLPFPVILESVVVHEVAHQWFYNLIGNDQIDEPWLDEAHAQYSTWLYFVDVYGEANARGYRDSWVGRWQRVEEAEIPIGLPAYAYEGNQYGAIVYGRGPLFLEALRDEMGVDSFNAFLRDYYETPSGALPRRNRIDSLLKRTVVVI